MHRRITDDTKGIGFKRAGPLLAVFGVAPFGAFHGDVLFSTFSEVGSLLFGQQLFTFSTFVGNGVDAVLDLLTDSTRFGAGIRQTNGRESPQT